MGCGWCEGNREIDPMTPKRAPATKRESNALQAPVREHAALDALERLQASVRARKVDIAGWKRELEAGRSASTRWPR